MIAPKVYSAICAVMEEIGKTGIAKDRKNQQQGYNFRGIDDVYNELNGILSRHGLVMLPSVVSSERDERQTKNGGALFYTRLTIDFKLVSSEDGSSDTIRTVGEAMDSADKSSNKAQSAAYKYAAMMVFCIPTEGDNDADQHTHEVAPRGSPAEDKPKPVSAAQQKRGLEEIDRELLDCATIMAVDKCAEGWRFIAKRDGWSRDYLSMAADKFNARKGAIRDAEAEDVFPADRVNGTSGNSYLDNVGAM